MNCTNCSLYEISHTTCLNGDGNQKAKIMFIQDSPDEADDIAGIPFSTPSCRALKKSLVNREIPIEEVYFTSLVRCFCEDISSSIIALCQPYLEDEIKSVDPDILVPTGNKSLKFCTGKVGLTKIRGTAQEVEICGRKRIILPMMSPKMVPIKPMYKSFILKDLDTLKDLYFNGMTKIVGTTYKYLETIKDVTEELIRMKQESKRIAFDIETTGKSPYTEYSKIICISLTDKSHYGVVIPLYKSDSPFSLSELGYIVKLLRWLLEDNSIPKSAHNGKFDTEWLKEILNINVKNFDFDTMFGHYIAISEEQGSQGLKSQAWEFTDMGGYDNELDDYVKRLSDGEGINSRYNYDRVPWDILKTYAAADADCCFRLVEIYKPLIDNNDMWKTLMKDILMPGSYALSIIESNGMKIDMKLSDSYQNSYQSEIDRIISRLYQFPEVLEIEREKQALYAEYQELAKIPAKDRTPKEKKKMAEYAKYKDYKFNFNSVINLRELLYDKLGLVTTVTTAKGALSTNETAMSELKKQHEIPALLLELKKVNTLNNMFIKKLPTMRDKDDIVHASFSLTGTVTGRTSSSDPNMQQIPRKAGDNPLLFQYHNEPKSLFISRFGEMGCIVNADYSALEMRIAAIISNDKKMTQAFLSGVDIHKANASYMYNIPVEEVTKDLRTKAKSLGFGIIYGKSGVTFAKDLFYDPSGKDPNKTTDWEKAKKQGFNIVEHFLNTFSGLKNWIERTKKFAYKHGYVETMFGRRRRLPDLNSKLSSLKADAERQAINAPIQGTGSDLTILSVVKLTEWLKNNNMKSLIVATVHDSIVFDVYIPELAKLSVAIKTIMEHVHEPYIDTSVPILTELELGKDYGSTTEISVEECKNILTIADFNDWLDKQFIIKYKNEILTLKKIGYNSEGILEYLIKYNRPVNKLSTYLLEIF